MDYRLPEELIGLRDMARKFAAEVIAPSARTWDREGKIPDEVIAQLGELGFLGLMVEEDLGGAGLGYLGASVVIEEIARHCGGTALMISAHNGLCCGHLRQGASQEQKAKYLPPLARGEMLGSWGLTESSSGSDAAALKTTAVKDGNEWVINGDKMFITNGDAAGVFIVTARTDPEARKHKGISAFIVERDTKGLIVGSKEDKLGMRASGTVPLTFEDMRVPAENLCGKLHGGFYDVLKVLERGRITIGSLSVGLGRGALEEATAYAKQREQFGKPLAEHQAIQFKLANMAVEVDAARLLVRKAAIVQDATGSSKVESAMCKLFASEMATRACLDAIQIHGGYGYMKDMPVERYLRDAKLCEIGEGSSEMQRLVIAREVLAQAV
ncbi:MAG TPA: acyl-CoA dehydrogenase family protein [Phycisphaerae bacterium]|nr:acyl-CoA dehydrogenase family protein [Phycisphaerae bacterium]